MSSTTKYLQVLNDRSTPKWVIEIMCKVIDMDTCSALSGIEAIQEILQMKFEEQKLQDLFDREGHDDTWDWEVRNG